MEIKVQELFLMLFSIYKPQHWHNIKDEKASRREEYIKL
jgi:hypothetical protein